MTCPSPINFFQAFSSPIFGAFAIPALWQTAQTSL